MANFFGLGKTSLVRRARLTIQAQQSSDDDIREGIKEAIRDNDPQRMLVLAKAGQSIFHRDLPEFLTLIEERRAIRLGSLLWAHLAHDPAHLKRGLEHVIKNDFTYTAMAVVQAGIKLFSGEGSYIKQTGTHGASHTFETLTAHLPHEQKQVLSALALQEALKSGKSAFALKLINQGAHTVSLAQLAPYYHKANSNNNQNLRRDFEARQRRMRLQGRENDPFRNHYSEKSCYPPLLLAVKYDLPRVVEAILETPPLTNNSDLNEALREACRRNHSDNYRLLHTAGGDVNQNTGVIISEAMNDGDIGRFAFLLQEGAELLPSHIALATEQSARPTSRGIKREFLSFLQLVRPITHPNNIPAVHNPRNIQVFLPADAPRPKKSDAFNAEQSWQQQPFIAASLQTAVAASVLGQYYPEKAKNIFDAIITADINRVENTKGLSWRRYLDALKSQPLPMMDFQDVIKEVAEAIFLPVLIRQDIASSSDIVLRPAPDSSAALSRTAKAMELAGQFIAQDKSTLDLLGLNAKWHRAGNRCPDELRPYLLIGEWHPLFDAPVDVGNNYTVECLSNPQQLKDEGSALSHCVGGYASSCREGKRHILSVRRHGVPQATLEIVADSKGEIAFPEGSQWQVRQFRGKSNAKPPVQAEQAFDTFKFMVSNGQIEENKKAGDLGKAHALFDRLDQDTKVMGFDLNDSVEVRHKLLAHYRTRVIVERSGGAITLFSPAAEAALEKWIASLPGQDTNFMKLIRPINDDE